MVGKLNAAPADLGWGREASQLATASRHPSAPVIAVEQPATMTHSRIIGPDKRANHQHRPDKHYSQMTAYRSVLATV